MQLQDTETHWFVICPSFILFKVNKVAAKIPWKVVAIYWEGVTSKGTPHGAGYATKHTPATPCYPVEPPNWSLN